MKIKLALVCLLLLNASIAFAYEIDKGVFWDIESIKDEPTSSAIDAKYVDMDVVDLSFFYKADIKKTQVVELTERKVYFGTTEGIQNNGYFSFVIDTSSETASIKVAQLLHADGTKSDVDPKTIQITNSSRNSVFTNSYEVYIPLTGLKVKDVALIKYEISRNKNKLQLPWSTILYPQNFRSRVNVDIAIDWHDSDLRPTWKTDLEQLQCEQNDRGLHCKADNLSPLKSDRDVNYYDIIPQFVITESRDWGELADGFSAHVDSALDASQDVREKAQDLIRNSTSQVEKLRKISEFVRREVRYISLSQEQHAVVPHRSGITLERRFGDCKDMTTLLIDLLAVAGIKANPVLVASDRTASSKLLLPAANYFDHMVACGVLDDGTGFCLDATDPYSDALTLSNSLQGRMALTRGVADSQPRPISKSTYRWELAVENKIRFLPDGSQEELSDRKYSGAYTSWLRATLASMDKDERLRWATESYENNIGQVKGITFEMQGVDTLDEFIQIQSSAEYEPLIDSEQDLEYTEVLGWLKGLLNNFKSENKFYDYVFSGFSYRAVHQYAITSRWEKLLSGPEIVLESSFGKMTRQNKLNQNTVTVYTEVSLPAAIIPLEKLADFNKFLSLVVRESKVKINGSLVQASN